MRSNTGTVKKPAKLYDIQYLPKNLAVSHMPDSYTGFCRFLYKIEGKDRRWLGV